MNKPCLKATVATVSLIVGSLISACANSGGQYEKETPSQDIMPGNVMRLTAAAEKDLTVHGKKLSAVFAVDKNGMVQVFAPSGSSIGKPGRAFPLPANDIKHMNTITTFQTSNPKTCWLMHGTLSCITW
jgi:hypothetical protein